MFAALVFASGIHVASREPVLVLLTNAENGDETAHSGPGFRAKVVANPKRTEQRARLLRTGNDQSPTRPYGWLPRNAMHQIWDMIPFT